MKDKRIKFENISIPKPCSENWDKMLDTEKSKYCLSCKKNIYDFSEMDEDSFNAFIKSKGGGKICGRFKKSQIGNGKKKDTVPMPSRREVPKRFWHIPRNIAAMLLFKISLVGSVFQSAKANPVVIEQNTADFVSPQSGNNDRVIKGHIKTALDKKALPYFKVEIVHIDSKKVIATTHADSLGFYKIKIPKQYKSRDGLYIRAVQVQNDNKKCDVEYETGRIIIDEKTDFSKVDFFLAEIEMMLLGEYYVEPDED